MEQHYETVFKDLLADLNSQIERVARRIAEPGGQLHRDQAERLFRLTTERDTLSAVYADLRHAHGAAGMATAAACEDNAVYVACDEANHPEVVTVPELADWFRDVESAERVHVYRQMDSGELEKLEVTTVDVVGDDQFMHFRTEIRTAAGELVETVGWDIKR